MDVLDLTNTLELTSLTGPFSLAGYALWTDCTTLSATLAARDPTEALTGALDAVVPGFCAALTQAVGFLLQHTHSSEPSQLLYTAGALIAQTHTRRLVLFLTAPFGPSPRLFRLEQIVDEAPS